AGDIDPVIGAANKVKSGLNEIVEQVMMMRRSTAGALRGLEMKVQRSFAHVEMRLNDLEASIEEVKGKENGGVEDGIDFSLSSRERVENLLSLKCGRLTKFALALEQELYEKNFSASI
ncbi:hypothetical protein GCK32_015369, partial [Trichostrongylus colubriformis]